MFTQVLLVTLFHSHRANEARLKASCGVPTEAKLIWVPTLSAAIFSKNPCGFGEKVGNSKKGLAGTKRKHR